MTRPRSRARRSAARTVAQLLVAVAAFVVGVAVGAALDDERPPAPATYERTLRFATVTVTQP